MAKEILLYGYIGTYSAEEFINQMESLKDEEITLRINTGGGDVLAGYGMIAKFAEHKKAKKIKVDGQASSMGAFFLNYSDNTEALNVSEFLVHRAAYPSWYESREGFKDSQEYNSLIETNKALRKGFENKIDVAKFEKISEKTLDEVFSMDSRIDVILTAKQAKQIGLINKVNELTSEMAAEINGNISMAASSELKPLQVKTNLKPKPKKMNLEEFKANHPALFAEVVAIGKDEEADRVASLTAFMEIDPVAVKQKIEAGEGLSQKFIADMTIKGMKQGIVADIEEKSPEEIAAEKAASEAAAEAEAEGKETEAISDFEKKLDEIQKIK